MSLKICKARTYELLTNFRLLPLNFSDAALEGHGVKAKTDRISIHELTVVKSRHENMYFGFHIATSLAFRVNP